MRAARTILEGEADDGADVNAQVDKFATTAQARQGDGDLADGDVEWIRLGVRSLFDSFKASKVAWYEGEGRGRRVK